jgi:hypothetical protein
MGDIVFVVVAVAAAAPVVAVEVTYSIYSYLLLLKLCNLIWFVLYLWICLTFHSLGLA